MWQGSSSVMAFLAPAKRQTFLSTPVHGLMAQHERGDIYIPGFDGSVLGSQTIIDVVCTHAHNKQGEVSATAGARGPRRPTAMAQAVRAKYAKHYGPYLGMGYSFCAFGTGTHGGLGLSCSDQLKLN
jgi:hypothetical protein